MKIAAAALLLFTCLLGFSVEADAKGGNVKQSPCMSDSSAKNCQAR